MPYLGNYQTGELKSKPRLTRINGDDNAAVIYRNLGNNHAYPFVFADTFTVVSGATTVVLASGIKFHGYDLATYGKIAVTPAFDSGAYYITKDSSANVISFTCTNAGASDGSSTVDVLFMLGEDAEVDGLYCRGNRGAAPSLP
jgi:hypothetical protein